MNLKDLLNLAATLKALLKWRCGDIEDTADVSVSGYEIVPDR